MPQFDLRGIQAGKYVNTAGTITYTSVTSLVDAMTANLELKFAEGRLYAESALAEYMRAVTGGTISLGVKYIPDAGKKLLFGGSDKSRTVGEAAIVSYLTTAKDTPNYVGVGFYAPDQIDGATKYTAVFVHKALFGDPAMSLATKGENITFNTPTTSGEFLASDATTKDLLETVVLDTEADAIAWLSVCFGYPAAATPTVLPEAGAVASGTAITLSCATAGATIYYTLNGVDPTNGSIPYSASAKPTITAATTLKAVAYKDGYGPSAILTAAYTLTA